MNLITSKAKCNLRSFNSLVFYEQRKHVSAAGQPGGAVREVLRGKKDRDDRRKS